MVQTTIRKLLPEDSARILCSGGRWTPENHEAQATLCHTYKSETMRGLSFYYYCDACSKKVERNMKLLGYKFTAQGLTGETPPANV
jgi:hypothetical protein